MESKPVDEASLLSSGLVKSDTIRSVHSPPEEGEGGLRRLQFPALDSGWLQQANSLATVFRDLQFNTNEVRRSRPVGEKQFKALEGQLDPLRLQYLGWLCSLHTDDDDGALSTSDEEVVDLIVESLDSIKTSLDELNTVITGLSGVPVVDVAHLLQDQEDDIIDNLENIDSALQNLPDISALMQDRFRPQPDDKASSSSHEHENTPLQQHHESGTATSPRPLSKESSVFSNNFLLQCPHCSRTFGHSEDLETHLQVCSQRIVVPPPDNVSRRGQEFSLGDETPMPHNRERAVAAKQGSSLLTLVAVALSFGLGAYFADEISRITLEARRRFDVEQAIRQLLLLRQWAPFRLDGLGVALLLGTTQVNNSLGRLVPSRYIEYLPVLNSAVIASNSHVERAVGFQLYNINHGICTPDLAGWLTRWLASQDFEPHRTCIEWSVARHNKRGQSTLPALVLSILLHGLLLAFTMLLQDWYGVTNCLAMVTNVVVRAYISRANCSAIDVAVDKALLRDWSELAPSVRALVVMPNDKAVTMFFPADLVRVFVKDPKPSHPLIYKAMRYVGWLAFAIHMVSMGMACLAAQLYTITLLVATTALTFWKFGCDDSTFPDLTEWWGRRDDETDRVWSCRFGSSLKATVSQWSLEQVGWNKAKEPKRQPRRQDVYAWLDLTENEERYMDKWNLFPQGDGSEVWMQQYRSKKAERQAVIRSRQQRVRI